MMRKFYIGVGLVVACVTAWLWLYKSPKSINPAATRPPVSHSDGGAQVGDTSETWAALAHEGAVLTNKTLPAVKSFLHALAGVGLSPIEPNLTTNVLLPMEAGSNKYVLSAKLVIDNKWIASFNEIPETDLTKRFKGITDFGQTGPANLYAAITRGDTNRLAAFARQNPMSGDTATILLQRGLSAILRKPVLLPEVYPEQFSGYDLNRWNGRWRKLGEDNWNQLDVEYELAIQPLNATQAVVVLYGNGAAGRK